MVSLSRKTDLHVFHFRAALPLGGDIDAAFTPRQIVDWAERFKVFDRFVLGNHPPVHFRIRTGLSPEEYLDTMGSAVEDLRRRFGGRLFKGIECDLLLKEGGEIGFNPGEKLLRRYDPEVSLIAFHFHRTFTYSNFLEIAVTDLVGALKWVIDSGMFAILAHPFGVLERVYREDRRGFERVANLARERKVALEINADKGFGGEPMLALIKNNNLFSFGGDFHALTYWLKRDVASLRSLLPASRDVEGLPAQGKDGAAIERLLGLTGEVAEKEKCYWRELDPFFWGMPYPDEKKRALRSYAVRLYRDRRFYTNEAAFERGLRRVVSGFGPEWGKVVEARLRELYRIYAKWGGAPTKCNRLRLERKYLLQVPLVPTEFEVYERWLVKAFELGLKREQFINSWDTPKLEEFLRRR